jgi:hypothetical protein
LPTNRVGREPAPPAALAPVRQQLRFEIADSGFRMLTVVTDRFTP